MPVDSLKPRGELPKAHAGFTPRVYPGKTVLLVGFYGGCLVFP